MNTTLQTTFLFLALCASTFFSPFISLAQDGRATDLRVTHGPLLGRPGADNMSLWVRTERPGEVKVFYGIQKEVLDKEASIKTTSLEPD